MGGRTKPYWTYCILRQSLGVTYSAPGFFACFPEDFLVFVAFVCLFVCLLFLPDTPSVFHFVAILIGWLFSQGKAGWASLCKVGPLDWLCVVEGETCAYNNPYIGKL
jgi:hypothetical protein